MGNLQNKPIKMMVCAYIFSCIWGQTAANLCNFIHLLKMGNLQNKPIKMMVCPYSVVFGVRQSCKSVQLYPSKMGNLQNKPIKMMVCPYSVVFGVRQLQICATSSIYM